MVAVLVTVTASKLAAVVKPACAKGVIVVTTGAEGNDKQGLVNEVYATVNDAAVFTVIERVVAPLLHK